VEDLMRLDPDQLTAMERSMIQEVVWYLDYRVNEVDYTVAADAAMGLAESTPDAMWKPLFNSLAFGLYIRAGEKAKATYALNNMKSRYPDALLTTPLVGREPEINMIREK
jgi:hypothetical protein